MINYKQEEKQSVIKHIMSSLSKKDIPTTLFVVTTIISMMLLLANNFHLLSDQNNNTMNHVNDQRKLLAEHQQHQTRFPVGVQRQQPSFQPQLHALPALPSTPPSSFVPTASPATSYATAVASPFTPPAVPVASPLSPNVPSTPPLPPHILSPALTALSLPPPAVPVASIPLATHSVTLRSPSPLMQWNPYDPVDPHASGRAASTASIPPPLLVASSLPSANQITTPITLNLPVASRLELPPRPMIPHVNVHKWWKHRGGDNRDRELYPDYILLDVSAKRIRMKVETSDRQTYKSYKSVEDCRGWEFVEEYKLTFPADWHGFWRKILRQPASGDSKPPKPPESALEKPAQELLAQFDESALAHIH